MLQDILQIYAALAAAGTALVITAGVVRSRRHTEAERLERAEWNLRARDPRA